MATPLSASPSVAQVALARVAASCASRGVRLTEPRRSVLGLLLATDKPLGAYGLMARLREATQRTVTPPTIYRALDFLLAQGFAHRIERLDAFVACSAIAAGHGAHAHAHQFLVCRRCGQAEEVHDPAVALALSHVAGRAGFAPGTATVEVEGECARCAGDGVARSVG